MTAILGLSAYYHDSAAALLVDGAVVAAAQEERFTRKKHDSTFPVHAIRYCLESAGLDPGDLDHVGFYDKPLLKFERLLETYLSFAPSGFRSFLMAMPLWLREKLHLAREMRKGLEGHYRKRFVFAEHHESHAASAFFPSPFHEAAILTMDGVGEWAATTWGAGRGNRIALEQEIRFPHSLGLLYSAFTYFCGFRVNSGEYKLMGLAPYGEPRFESLIREKLIDMKPDGSFRLDLSYFNFCQGLTMTSRRFERLFGGPPRKPESPIGQREVDLAASIQRVAEDVVLRAARHVHDRTGMKALCLAGGVALNCVANGRLLREGPFEQIWIQPAAGDAGGALGVALFIWHQLLGNPRLPRQPDSQQGSLLGPSFSNEQIVDLLRSRGAKYRVYGDEEELFHRVAGLLAAEKVVGWFQGRMEFGPRALGSRSILGDARSDRMQSLMNLKIKFRESFRPFAPAVLAERAAEYFDLCPGQESPYMLLTAPVRTEKRRPCECGKECGKGGITDFSIRPDAELRSAEIGDVPFSLVERLRQSRSVVPAVTHVDYSARVQTVDPVRHGRFYRLLKAFETVTGCPMLINTSFNVRGEPIVCSPEDAYRCFMSTEMDALVLENCLLVKEEQTAAKQHRLDEYLSQFPLD